MNDREPIRTDAAPGAIGPYSQAITTGSLVFASGQIGTDPASGKLAGESAREQVRQVLANVEAVLAAAGSGLDRVVKTTIFLVDMADFESVNAVYTELMPQPFPARSTVAVAALPRGARVEIECIALAGSTMTPGS
jgi:2-iminobutanoate/2-iminopropanoate deaminase